MRREVQGRGRPSAHEGAPPDPEETGTSAGLEGGLSVMADVEARLEARLEEARAEASREVLAAEEAGRQAEAGLSVELVALARELEEQAASECESALAEISAQTAAAASRFDSIVGQAVDELVRVVIEGLLQGPRTAESGPA